MDGADEGGNTECGTVVRGFLLYRRNGGGGGLSAKFLHYQGKICFDVRSPAHDRSISGEKVPNCFDQTWNVVLPGLYPHSEPAIARSLAGNRPDRGDQHPFWPGYPESKKIFDG